MNSLAIPCGPFFEWLVRTTIQASVLVAIILVLQRVFRHRLGVRGRYWLWMVLLVRMAMPWAPPSRMSLYNVLSVPAGPISHASDLIGGSRTQSAVSRKDAGSIAQEGTGMENAAAIPARGPNGRIKEHWTAGRTVRGLLWLWLLGACALAGYTIAGSARLWRIVRNGQRVTNRDTLDLLATCKHLIGTQAAVGVIATDTLGGPALFGCVRPKLLIPHRTLREARPLELRHIFLHELAHLKRCDILIGHLASLLHILHWFNPLIAIGLQRMRADRELACDAMAVSRLAPAEAPAYARTILGQFERLLTSPYRSALVNLCSIRAQIKHRIAMIAGFTNDAYRGSALPMALVGVLACIGLTNAHVVDKLVELDSIDWDLYARQDFPTTHTDKHANIQRAYIRNRLTGCYLVVNGETVTCDTNEPGPAALWEYRFDEVTNKPDVPMYLYSVAARKYLGTDEEGRLTVDADEPDKTTRWGAWPNARGVWLISHYYKDGYLCLMDDGGVVAYGRDPGSYWDIHSVWRIKTGDAPSSNPQWQREKIPGPD